MLARMTNANLKASAKRYLDRRRSYTAIMMPNDPNAPKPDVPQNQPKTPKRQPPKDPKIVPGVERP